MSLTAKEAKRQTKLSGKYQADPNIIANIDQSILRCIKNGKDQLHIQCSGIDKHIVKYYKKLGYTVVEGFYNWYYFYW